jgi:hypothetical protein
VIAIAKRKQAAVGIQMRHQDDVDAFGIDAGGGKILQRAADRALAGFEICDAVAAIDQHQLAAVVDQLRIERHRHHRRWHDEFPVEFEAGPLMTPKQTYPLLGACSLFLS